MILTAVAALGWGASLVAQRTAYQPDPVVASTPAALQFPFDTIAFETADAIMLHGWFVPATDTNTAGTVLLLRDGTGNIGQSLHKLRALRQLGFNILAFDYRGFGRSGGTPSEAGLNLDALAAYHFVIDKRGVDPQKLFLYGEGLGAAIAVQLAAVRPAAGLIAEGAFISMADVAIARRPYFPWRVLLRCHEYNTLARIHAIHMPLLLIHSEQDQLIPYRHAQRLFAAAVAPKELVTVHGPHGEAYDASADLFREKISAFTSQALNPAAAEQTDAPAGQTS